MLYTDCRSLFDHLAKDGSVPEDKWAAVAVAALRCAVSSGPGRNIEQAECRRVPSRWQLADCLTKTGLALLMIVRMRSATTRLHEPSFRVLKQRRGAAAHAVWACRYSPGAMASSPGERREVEK